MAYKPSDSYAKEFVTSSPTTGAAINADSLPTATADFDGSGTGSMALTVANLDAGRYKITGTIPAGRVKGDVLNVSVAATVGGIAGKAVVESAVLDSKRVGDLNDSAYAGADTSGITTLLTRIGGSITISGGKVAATVASGDDADAAAIKTTIGVAGAGLTAVTAATVGDKTGYSLTQSFPSNFSSLAITGGGAVTAGTVSDKTGYTAATVSDKTGYSLAAAGLDAISTTAPAGVASNFREMMVQTWRRFFRKATRSTTQILTYADNGTSVLTTQTISDDGSGNEVQGAAS